MGVSRLLFRRNGPPGNCPCLRRPRKEGGLHRLRGFQRLPRLRPDPVSYTHLLRGRVGRGKHQSYCVLITNTRIPDSLARLRTLASTTDGFRIAEEDLKLRGPGDFFGSRQHGLPQLALADLSGDLRLLQEAQAAARSLLQSDPGLSRPENRPVLERVRRLFADTPDIFN